MTAKPRKRKSKAQVKALIAGGRLPEDTVTLCLRADLVAEFEAAEAELGEAIRTAEKADSLDGGDTDLEEIAGRIQALRAQMLDQSLDVVLRGMPRPKWRAFIDEHPPRKDPDTGDPDQRDRSIGVNTETFFPELIRRSVVDPELDADDWRALLGDVGDERARRVAAGEPVEDGKLTDRQFDTLANTAWALNRQDVDVPFSPAASRILRTSSGG